MYVLGDQGKGSEDGALLSQRMETMSQQLTALQDQLSARDATIEGMQAAIAAGRGGGLQRQTDPAALAGMVDAAVARALAERAAAGTDGLATALGADAEAEALRAKIIPDAMRRLIDPLLSDEDREAIWAEIRDAGLVEEAIAALEGEVDANPENTGLLVELGYAYLQPIFAGSAAGPEAGIWSMKSDATFDRALTIDPENWDARFSKAISYSFWPAAFGKQPEAIQHFQTLIDQQGSRPQEDRFVQPYIFLGNLLAQTGKQAEAEAAWRSGLEKFPNDATLKKSLGQE